MYPEDWLLVFLVVLSLACFILIALVIGESIGWWELNLVVDSNDIAPDGYEGSGY